jgi:hypothetical protein
MPVRLPNSSVFTTGTFPSTRSSTIGPTTPAMTQAVKTIASISTGFDTTRTAATKNEWNR